MKISYNWLKEYVTKLPKPEKLAEILTMHSFEVKSIEKKGNDFILDIDILPNRAHDCLCYLGVARECAALLKLKIKDKKFQPKAMPTGRQADPPRVGKTENFVSVEIKDKELCPRYCARYIGGVKIRPSPKWLKEKLEVIGQQSINNIVDVVNYVMFETGQPLHAFDAEKLSGNKIIVRKAKKGEKITTLDNEKYDLDENILVIADTQEPLAIAGIKGGKKAEIDKNTKNIILESANFNLNNIHASSRRLELRTEASLRFEHGLDPNLAEEAINRVTGLIQKLAGGKIAKGIVDVYPWKLKPRKISLKLSKIFSVFGIEIPEKEIIKILNSLGFKTRIISPVDELVKLAKSLIGRSYKYGASTSQEAPDVFDCSSFTRYLYRQIGVEIPRVTIEQIEVGGEVDKKDLEPGDLVFSKGFGKPHRNKKWPQGIGHVGIYIGKGEIIHASSRVGKVVKTKIKNFLSLTPYRASRRILEEKDDRLMVEIPTLRLDLELPEDLIEEIGRIYGYEKISLKLPIGVLAPAKSDDLLKLKNKVKDILDGLGLTEVYNYSFIGEDDLKNIGANKKDYLELENPLSAELKYLRRDLMTNLLRNARENFRYFDTVKIFEIGNIYLEKEKIILGGAIGQKSRKEELFYEVKGIIDGLLNKLGISDQWYDDFQITPQWSNKNFWNFNRSAEIKIGDKKIGFVGEISPQILSGFKIKNRIAAFEINFELLVSLVDEELDYQPPSKYPAVVRDIAILVNQEDRVDDVLNIINRIGGPLVFDVDLFDMYEGEEIPGGKRNLAFHIIYQSEKRTLIDEEVDIIHQKIVRELERRRGWEVRK